MRRGLLSRPEARWGLATLLPSSLTGSTWPRPFAMHIFCCCSSLAFPPKRSPFLYAWRPLAGVSDRLVSCNRWTGRRRATGAAARRAEAAGRQRMQLVRSACSMCRTTRWASTRAPIRSATAASADGARTATHRARNAGRRSAPCGRRQVWRRS